MSSKTLFPDTNIFLHYPPLRDIDWLNVAGASDVRLIICLQVIKELDAKKDDPRLADRARRALREIREAAKSEALRPSVSLAIYNEELRLSDFPTTLSPDSADDRIVFQVRQYQEKHPREAVTVVTEDYGMELRCEANAVDVLHLPVGLRLEEPGSELAKKHQQALAELDALRTRLPQLALRISPADTDEVPGSPPRFVLRHLPPLDAQDELARAREKYPRLKVPQRATTGMPLDSVRVEQLLGVTNMNEPAPSEFHRYNRELEEYFTAYPEYVAKLNGYRDKLGQSFEFSLWLTNDGSAPAEDIDISLTIPTDVVDVVAKEDEDPLTEPAGPPFPERPKSYIDRHMGPLQDFSHLRHDVSRFLQPSGPIEGVRWVSVDREPSGFVIRAKVGRVKHHHRRHIETFVVRFRSWNEVRTFEADAVITAGNHPKRITGRIPFIVSLE